MDIDQEINEAAAAQLGEQDNAAEHERLARDARERAAVHRDRLATLRARKAAEAKTYGQRVAEEMLTSDGEGRLWFHFPEALAGGGQIVKDGAANHRSYIKDFHKLIAFHVDKARADRQSEIADALVDNAYFPASAAFVRALK